MPPLGDNRPSSPSIPWPIAYRRLVRPFRTEVLRSDPARENPLDNLLNMLEIMEFSFLEIREGLEASEPTRPNRPSHTPSHRVDPRVVARIPENFPGGRR